MTILAFSIGGVTVPIRMKNADMFYLTVLGRTRSLKPSFCLLGDINSVGKTQTNEKYIQTYDCEVNKMAEMWGGRHLTFVHSGITVLGIFYLQHPVFGMGLVDGSKALVARVSVTAHC